MSAALLSLVFILSANADAGDAPAFNPLDDAAARVQKGDATEALEAVGEIISHARHKDFPASALPRARGLLIQAAQTLSAAGELKGAAVAADAAVALGADDATKKLAAAHLTTYADVLADDDEAAARGLVERAVSFDATNTDAIALRDELQGKDTWQVGHVTLLGGVGLAAITAATFISGLDIEREARVGNHSRAELDVLLAQRTAAGVIAWVAAASSAIALGAGLALIMAHDPGAPPTIPLPFEGATE